MRNSVVCSLIVLSFWAVLGLLALRAGASAARDAAAPGPETPAATGIVAAAADPAEAAAPALPAPRMGFDAAFRLPVLREGETVSMDLHSYLTGVLLAELPDRFADETRKAQAVASRTYALRSYAHRRHGEAALCTGAGCCQGWQDPDSVSPERRARAEAAVTATDGLVIRYGGELIDATFFSCSGGQTEDAAAVWGNELPYLRAVESPGEEAAAHFTDETRLSLSALRAALEELDPAVRLEGAPETWIGAVTHTPGGGVDEIELGGRSFRGTQLRKRFGLRSTVFTLELNKEEAVFRTRGSGHRVGMSQYGAEAMARAGNDFVTILTWYYTGVTVEPAES